jgi:hypothetical protein
VIPEHACTDCDGTGRQRIAEPDEPAKVVLCEGCDGGGLITSCRDCFDAVPSRFADDNHGLCPLCVEEHEKQTAADEAFLRRRFAG